MLKIKRIFITLNKLVINNKYFKQYVLTKIYFETVQFQTIVVE